jgi:uncharacterized protein YkwD
MTARAALLLTTAALALAAIAVICGRAIAAASSDPCLNSDAPATRLADEQYTDAIACLINLRRAAAGRRALTGSTQLQRAAVRHSADMVAGRFFSHTGRGRSTMVSRLRATGYIRRNFRWQVGENLAWATGTLSTPRSIVEGWMESPEHRANILFGRFRDLGVGAVHGTPLGGDAGRGITVTADFGLRRR